MSYANPLTPSQYINKMWPSIKNIYIWKKIKIKQPDGTEELLFDPTGYAFVVDTKACGVFTQRPTTVEAFRDVDAGVDFAYMRKYFKTAYVQLEAAHMLDSIGY